MNTIELLDLFKQIFPYIFGGGGVLMFFGERRKRKIDLAQQETGALKSMQQAYDTFIGDANKVIGDLKKEVVELNKKIDQQHKDFEEYKNQCPSKH